MQAPTIQTPFQHRHEDRTQKKTKIGSGEKPEPGITCRKIKFSQTGIDHIKILKNKFPEQTISGLVLLGLKALLGLADCTPVIRYMRMAGKEIISLRALLAEAREILDSFRDDLLVARGKPEMIIRLSERAEGAIDKIESISDEIAALADVSQPTHQEIDLLELAALSLEAQIDMAETDENVRKAFKCAIKHLGFKLPVTS